MNRWKIICKKAKRNLPGLILACSFWCFTFPQLALPKDAVSVVSEGEYTQVDATDFFEEINKEEHCEVKLRFRLWEKIKDYFSEN